MMRQIEEPDFTTLLNTLQCHQSQALYARDSHLRNTLHYAALYGLSNICQHLLEILRSCTTEEAESVVSSTRWQDLDGYTPFQLALIHGYVDCAKVILRSSKSSFEGIKKMPQVLRICTMLNHIQSLRLLLEVGIDPIACDENGESLLHLAARLGHQECVAALLERPQVGGVVDYQDHLLRSTALIEACRSGHIQAVELLLCAGADTKIRDALGWSAKEHAAFRGYHFIVERLEESDIKGDRSDRITQKPPGLSPALFRESDEAEISPSREFLAPSPPISNPSSPCDSTRCLYERF